MTEFPEKTCDVDRLVRSPKLVKAVLDGVKTQQRRDGVYAYPGETFKLEDKTFEVVSLTQETLGQMTDAEAKAEGFGDMESYRALIVRMHPGMEWDPSHQVWVHEFRLQS